MEFKPLETLDDILNFINDNSDEFPEDKIASITNTIKEKKLEILLQSKVDKNIFDFSDIKNYPIRVKDIAKIVYSNEDVKINPFEIAEFFGIRIKKIIEKSKDKAYLHYMYEKDIIEIGYKDFTEKGYENFNAFLVGHELGHLFNHYLLSVFFENETYNTDNHKLLDNIKNIISNENIANNNINIVRKYMNQKVSFSNNININEIEADIFSLNILYYPLEVPIKNNTSKFSRKLRKYMYRQNDDK